MLVSEPCPCGTGQAYGRCCRDLHTGERLAETAEQLMRSRYSAYAVGDGEYVWRTWHPRTRPESVDLAADRQWTGLRILDTAAGLAGDEQGEVEFRAQYRSGGHAGVLHERSRFTMRARRWFYVDGDLLG